MEWSLSPAALRAVLLVLLVALPAAKPTGPAQIEPRQAHTYQDRDGGKYFRYFSLDEDNGYLYVGARMFVYRLDLTDISRQPLRSPPLHPHSRDLTSCKAIQLGDKEDFKCANHIRAIYRKENGQGFYVCGTGALAPVEFNLSSSLQLLSKGLSKSGMAKCPFDPEDEAVSLYIKSDPSRNREPYFFTATHLDKLKKKPMIYRTGNGDVRTKLTDQKWLHSPTFVGVFEIDEYVYFFFREIALENTNCGKKMVSRVARVCRNDPGGLNVLRGYWTTYFKATLNCSIPGDFPFYFDFLRDVQKVGSNEFIGVFTTPKAGLYGSAVCAFTLHEIERAFDGQFKEQANSNSLWRESDPNNVPDPRPGQCEGESPPEYVCQWILSRPLMARAVRADLDKPLFFHDGVIYTKFVVDVVSRFKVFFLATEEGAIHKVVQWNAGQETKTHFVAKWKLFEDTIHQLKIYNGYLYVGLDHLVLQYPVAQCDKYTLCTDCVKDPYCGWDLDTKCQEANGETSRLVRGEDNLDSNPMYLCDTRCRISSSSNRQTDTYNEVRIRIPGDPAYLHCRSHCTPSEPIGWWIHDPEYGGDVPVDVHLDKYNLTSDSGLIVYNVTAERTYTCKSGGITLAAHKTIIPFKECRNNVECMWKKEFRDWCASFDKYKEEFNKWNCLKTKCLNDDSCMPNVNHQQCIAP